MLYGPGRRDGDAVGARIWRQRRRHFNTLTEIENCQIAFGNFGVFVHVLPHLDGMSGIDILI